MIDPEMVRRLAAASRIALDADELARLSAQLSEILDELDVLKSYAMEAGAGEGNEIGDAGARGVVLHADEVGADPLQHELRAFVPELRDGFVTVPRLQEHTRAE